MLGLQPARDIQHTGGKAPLPSGTGGGAILINPVYWTTDVLYTRHHSNKHSIITCKGAANMEQNIQEILEQLNEANRERALSLAAALLAEQSLNQETSASAPE